MPRPVQVLLRCCLGRATVPVVPSLHGCSPPFTHLRGPELNRVPIWRQWAPALPERLVPVLRWALWAAVCLPSSLCSASWAFLTKQKYQKQLILSLCPVIFFTPLLRVLFSVRKWDCAPGNTIVSPNCNALSNWNRVACLPNVILHTRCVIWKGSVEARTTCIPHFTVRAIRVSSPLIPWAKLNACRTSTELFGSWGLDSVGLPRIQLQRLHHNGKYFWIS